MIKKVMVMLFILTMLNTNVTLNNDDDGKVSGSGNLYIAESVNFLKFDA